jgi:hypothetical protein
MAASTLTEKRKSLPNASAPERIRLQYAKKSLDSQPEPRPAANFTPQETIMEFFAIADIAMPPAAIREKITLAALPDYCESFALVESIQENSCEVESIWGRFQVTRQEINGGLRFTMPTCPNCFAWTITSGLPPAPGQVVIHSTINRTEHEPWFIESMEEFVVQWRSGLEGTAMKTMTAPEEKTSLQPLPGLRTR